MAVGLRIDRAFGVTRYPRSVRSTSSSRARRWRARDSFSGWIRRRRRMPWNPTRDPGSRERNSRTSRSFSRRSSISSLAVGSAVAGTMVPSLTRTFDLRMRVPETLCENESGTAHGSPDSGWGFGGGPRRPRGGHPALRGEGVGADKGGREAPRHDDPAGGDDPARPGHRLRDRVPVRLPLRDLLAHARDDEDVVVHPKAHRHHEEGEGEDEERVEAFPGVEHDDREAHRPRDAQEDREDRADRDEDRTEDEKEDDEQARDHDDGHELEVAVRVVPAGVG